MPLTALLTRETRLRGLLSGALGEEYALAATPSWAGLCRTVRERPVTLAVLDGAALPRQASVEVSVRGLRQRFPGLGIVLLSRRHDDPVRLFQLGRTGVPELVLLPVDDLATAVPAALRRASKHTTATLVSAALGPYLPRFEHRALRSALDGVHRRWSAEEFASVVGLSRPFLSERLKACGLPSTGHLLLWVRLLHAGFWLREPGRTGESVSRQLEYSSGAAFRRALKHYTGATPTQVAERGGMTFVLERFFGACRFTPPPGRFTAA